MAVVDSRFSQVFRCPSPSVNYLTGTVRALCRLCANLSDPSNGLVLPSGAECFPAALLQSGPSCLRATFSSVTECSGLLTQAETIDAKFAHNTTTNSLVFLAMAFRSVSSPLPPLPALPHPPLHPFTPPFLLPYTFSPLPPSSPTTFHPPFHSSHTHTSCLII